MTSLCLSVTAFGIILSVALNVVCQDEHLWSVTGVAGRSSDLPCYLNPRTPGDRPKLVLWYKRGQRTPVYSHDGRKPEMRSEFRKDRRVLNVNRGAATLTLNNLTSDDAGVYECRVDFFKSPTHTNFVNLTIVEPPSTVEIVDSFGSRAQRGQLGPYQEGVSVSLACRARGGSPSPNVTWWKDEKLISSMWVSVTPGIVQNELEIGRMSRDYHNASLTCIAANTHLASPVSVSVTIAMFLLPTSVVITNPGAVKEGEQARLICTSEGSLPSAILTWTVRGATKPAEKDNLVYGPVTSSMLVTNVSRKDDGSLVTCSATNPSVPGHKISNTTQLVVHYPPTVTAALGRSLNPNLLKEGDDVYFSCAVDANPKAYTITWYHEDKVQVQNVSMGVILSGESLVLQKVSRRRAGQYRCSATNVLATVTSLPVHLQIKYKPECQTSPTTYFIYDKPINVTCSVTSYPPVRSIQWQWNSSNDVISTEPITEEEERVSAQLTVEPIKSREDRTLTCWAVNEMGKQSRPCGFSVKVAQMPLPLSSCRLANITASSLSLTCQRPNVATAGTTLYRAEVYFDNRTLFANVTSHRPNFNVSRLDAGTSYQIKVYVTHGPVTSQPVVVSAYTSRSSRPSAGSRDGGSSVGELVGGVGVALLLLAGGVWARQYCRKQRNKKKHEPRVPSDESNPDVVPTTVEETLDLLAAGAVKSEVPILTPVYEAMNASMQEVVPKQTLASAEVYSGARLQHQEMDEYLDRRLQRQDIDEYQEMRLQHRESEEYQAGRLQGQDNDPLQGGRSNLHCPVDQLMQAAETVV